MRTPLKEFAILRTTFASRLSRWVWYHGPVLRVGAMLAPGQRTVPAAIWGMGLAHAKAVQPDHRVLNRAIWSSLAGVRLLLRLLVQTLARISPLVLGLDATLERRRGAQSRAKGSSRDPVRSSPSHLVTASGGRWVSLMRLLSIPWAKRVRALPCLTILAPSERDHQERGQRHKTPTDWARPKLLVVRRWLPTRADCRH